MEDLQIHFLPKKKEKIMKKKNNSHIYIIYVDLESNHQIDDGSIHVWVCECDSCYGE